MGSTHSDRLTTVLSAPAETERRATPLTRDFVVKAFVICLSFANLCFVNVWAEVTDRDLDFFKRYLLSWQELAAVTLDVLLLAVLLFIPVYLAAKSGNRKVIWIVKVCALAGLLYPLNILRKWVSPSVFPPFPVRIALAVAGVAAIILLVRKWGSKSIAVTYTVLTISSPLLPVVVAGAAWNIHTKHAEDRLPLAMIPQKAGAPRVLWFIFDEWDGALTFGRRPANFTLPHLDRFRSESFHADRAYTVSRETVISVPSLLTGKIFLDKQWKGTSELLLTYDPAKPPEPLTSERTIFSEVRAAGYNAAIAGNYLPYCRLFDVATCEWHGNPDFRPPEWEVPTTVGEHMVLAARRQVDQLPFSRRIGFLREIHENAGLRRRLLAVPYREIHEAAMRSIADPRLNLVFVHWDFPHPTARFEAAKDDFSDNPANTYLDNLKLVDRTVRDIRSALEQANLWDSSTILLTSDHPLRVNNWDSRMLAPPQAGEVTQTSEVPFLLKMAGQKEEFEYSRAMQTVVTKDLLLSIMRGELTRPEQVAAWLDRNPPRL